MVRAIEEDMKMEFKDRFRVGMTSQRRMQVTKNTIQEYANLSGDYNPIHLDETYAQKTLFGKCIAHGGIAAALISSVLGNDLPGPGCVFVKQEFSYLKPVYPDDLIAASVEICEIVEQKRHIYLKTRVINQNGESVVVGTALMKILME